MNDEITPFPYEKLPDDVVLLKEYLREQVALSGLQALEMHLLKQELKTLRSENRKLKGLLWPTN